MCTYAKPSEYLQCCLGTYAMRHIDNQVAFHREKRDVIQKALEQKYKGKLAGNIIYSGSVAKSTEINIKYDVDLIIPFKYDAFPNLEEMSKDLFKFFQTEFKDPHKLPPRDQRVSVGLTFTKPGATISMDIVPGREIKRDGYEPDHYLNLYDSNEKRYFQTNIKKQIDAIKASHDNARNIIRLLKVWKVAQSRKALKGFTIELLVMRAFKDAGDKAPNGLWPQLEMTLKYIRDNIETAKLVDPGNSNNSVSELLTPLAKTEIANAMRNMLNSLNTTPSKLTTFFPCNKQFE
jgi:ribosomal protein L22